MGGFWDAKMGIVLMAIVSSSPPKQPILSPHLSLANLISHIPRYFITDESR
jgi:hypothetical protein